MGTRTNWPVILMAWGAGIAAAAHIGKLPPVLPFIRADLGLDLVTGGWVVSTINLTGIVLGVISGVLGDKVGQRRLVMMGLSALALGSLLASQADGAATILLARFIEGIGFAATVTTAAALIVQAAEPQDRKRALALWATFFPVGIILMMLVASVVGASGDWRSLMLLASGLTLAWLAIFSIGTRHFAPASLPKGLSLGANLKRVARAPAAWFMGLAFCAFAIEQMAVVGWLPSFLIETRATSVLMASLATSGMLLVLIAGNFWTGIQLTRGRSYWLLISASALGLMAATFVIFDDSLADWLRYGGVLAFGLVGGVTSAAILASPAAFAPSMAQLGTFSGFLTTGSSTGQFLGPPLLAAVVAAGGGAWEDGLTLTIACSLVILGAGLVIRRIEKASVTG